MTDRTNIKSHTIDCEVCESLCLDAADGLLEPAEQTAFDRHLLTCADCAEQFAEAQRGAAWMEMLRTHRPEPSPTLLANILARTSGTAEDSDRREAAPEPETLPTRLVPMPVPVVPLPGIVASPAVAGGSRLIEFPRRFPLRAAFSNPLYAAQSRLALTAAMALFSVALTMNLTDTHLRDLRPSALRRTVADAGAQAARRIQGLRVVYQVEAKVNELRDDNQNAGPERIPERMPDRREDDGGLRQPDPVPSPKPTSEGGPARRKQPAAPGGSSELRQPALPGFGAALRFAANRMQEVPGLQTRKGA